MKESRHLQASFMFLALKDQLFPLKLLQMAALGTVVRYLKAQLLKS